MKYEFEFRTDNPAATDGFRFLVISYDNFTKSYQYQVADYCIAKKEWRKPKTFEKLNDKVFGWCKLPNPEKVVWE